MLRSLARKSAATMTEFLSTQSNFPSTPSLIIVGKKKALVEQANDSSSWLSSLIGKDPILPQLIQSLSPSKDKGDTVQHWITTEASELQRVAMCALPLAISRHNCKAQPHAITQLLKQNLKVRKPTTDNDSKDKEETSGPHTTVALLLQDPDHAFAAGCAVPRALTYYSRKSSKPYGAIPQTDNTTKAQPPQIQVVFSHAIPTPVLEKMSHTSRSIGRACRLVDAPPNELNTDAFVAEAQALAEALPDSVSCQVIQGEELKEKGLMGLYGVGQAAVHPPALVILSHKPTKTESTNPEKNAVVLVGKGIIYDTGGLSLKTKAGMPGMKRDMGGAAAVFSAFEAAVNSNTYQKGPLHCILCLAENAIGNRATRPDDVQTLYSGQTVEVNNTDAEGRLVLSDGVAYATKHLHPSTIVDMATLTGAQGVATGRYFAALYCNDDTLEEHAVLAGRASGDLVHPLPYAPEFFRQEFGSAVADMKNSVKDRTNAQSSCAGQFIGNHMVEFVEGDGDGEKKGRWLHVDMAYPVESKGDERATGFGVALVQNLLGRLNEEEGV